MIYENATEAYMRRVVLIFFLLVPVVSWSSSFLEVKLDKVFSIGESSVVLSDNVYLTEDPQGNAFVLDAKLHKIYKFSPGGKLLLEFGKRGKGPGDVFIPHHICISEKNQLVVLDLSSISFFDLDGKFQKKHSLSKAASLLRKKYAGGNYILARRLNRHDLTLTPRLVLISFLPEVKVVDNHFMTTSSQEDYKGEILFHDSFSPDIWFAYSNNRSVVVSSDTYRVRLVDKNGRSKTIIQKKMDAPVLSKKERQYIIETEVETLNGVDEAMKNGLIKTIPPIKSLITGIALSKSTIFIARTKDDITIENSPVPVDMYTVSGKFLGKIRLKTFPVHVTDRHFYFKEETDSGDIIITKKAYKIAFQKN
jgi:hypothetical protein